VLLFTQEYWYQWVHCQVIFKLQGSCRHRGIGAGLGGGCLG
jgi:hypothetical protein